MSLQENQPTKRRGRALDPASTSCAVPAASLDQICFAIRAAHRQRVFAMGCRKKIDLSLGSFLRSNLGWRYCEADDKEQVKKNAEIRKLSADLMTCGEKTLKGKPHDLADSEHYQRFGLIIEESIKTRAGWDHLESIALKEMETQAALLPVWKEFGEGIRGFGLGSLAVVIGETGNLSNYETHSRVWKRLGLAVLNGIRQGGLPKGAPAEEWIAHGYNRARRSRIFVIGDVLIKVNKGEYRALYDERKAYEIARDPEIRPIVSHRRAQRYMEKALIRALWKAWRRTDPNR
jgi:hypothetical protein